MPDHCTPHVFYCLLCAVNFKKMIEFHKAKDKFTDKSVSFEIDHKTDELQIESEEYSKYETERHTYIISKDEAKKLVEYLSEWVSA